MSNVGSVADCMGSFFFWRAMIAAERNMQCLSIPVLQPSPEALRDLTLWSDRQQWLVGDFDMLQIHSSLDDLAGGFKPV